MQVCKDNLNIAITSILQAHSECDKEFSQHPKQ
jgi:hypothetical protein